MIHMTVSAFLDGPAPTPHFAPYKKSLDSEYYRENILANDVLPEIRAAVLSSADQDAGEHWVFMHDLASPHADCPATKLLKQ